MDDEQEPETNLTSPIIGPEKQYRGTSERLDRALLVGAVAGFLAIIVAVIVAVHYLVPPW